MRVARVFSSTKTDEKVRFRGRIRKCGRSIRLLANGNTANFFTSASVEFNTASEPMMVNNIDIYHRDCGHQDPPQKKAKIITIRDNGQRNF